MEEQPAMLVMPIIVVVLVSFQSPKALDGVAVKAVGTAESLLEVDLFRTFWLSPALAAAVEPTADRTVVLVELEVLLGMVLTVKMALALAAMAGKVMVVPHLLAAQLVEAMLRQVRHSLVAILLPEVKEALVVVVQENMAAAALIPQI